MKIRDIVLIGVMSATLTAGKMALSFVPNVEIITLLFIIYSSTIGFKRSLIAAFLFATTEIFLYGFGTWLLGYYIVWPILVMLTSIINRKTESEYIFAILAGIYGLLFGMFFAITESFFYGIAYGITYWISGLPFDIVHGLSNFILVLFLFKPLKNIISKQLNLYN